MYGALEIIEKENGPNRGIHKGIKMSSQIFEVKSRGVGGATYQVPVEVREEKELLLRFVGLFSAKRSGPKYNERRMAASLKYVASQRPVR